MHILGQQVSSTKAIPEYNSPRSQRSQVIGPIETNAGNPIPFIESNSIEVLSFVESFLSSA
jgi:hypothetical protein